MLTILVITGIQIGIIRYDAVKAGAKPAAADSAGALAYRVGFEKALTADKQTLAEKWILANDSRKIVTADVVEAVEK